MSDEVGKIIVVWSVLFNLVGLSMIVAGVAGLKVFMEALIFAFVVLLCFFYILYRIDTRVRVSDFTEIKLRSTVSLRRCR